jgi:hypothetical protein
VNVGKPIATNVAVELPTGRYVARLYSPVGGEYSPSVPITAEEGKPLVIELPEFTHDVVLRVTRKK